MTSCHLRVGKEIGVPPEVILETSHGRRSIDILKILAPEKANWECKSFLGGHLGFSLVSSQQNLFGL